mmetsp:Transcript_20952/g.18472  ORF Transcript_20952/g.18472 Transcript_20952/m.18472 type:complete len:136 (-) Transcript_20952:50-457(-)
MDPGWMVIFVFLMVESVIVGLLVMPMPANVVRGAIVTTIGKLWNTNSAIRYISWLIVGINVIYFVMTYKNVYYSPPPEMLTRWEECDTKIMRFREQRNLYITGFSIFLFFVFRRVLEIQSQLHQARKNVKESKGK